MWTFNCLETIVIYDVYDSALRKGGCIEMKNEKELLQEAIDALRSKDKKRANKILDQITRKNPQNELAWLYLSYAVDGYEDKIVFLNNALEINPTNEKAKELLSRLEEQKKTQSTTSSEIYKQPSQKQNTDENSSYLGNNNKLSQPKKKNQSKYVTIPLFVILCLAVVWLFVEVGRLSLPFPYTSLFSYVEAVDSDVETLVSYTTALGSDVDTLFSYTNALDSELSIVGAIARNADLYSHTHNYSDINLKRDISNLENSLENVTKLRGVTFFWKTETELHNMNMPEDNQVGFIAQEVEKIYPELVTIGPDGFMQVDYEKFTPILVEAIKEQQDQIASLEEKNAELEERLDYIESLLDN